ncbi:hypothetical protein [uncultured Limosilactobacillus sp.]|uniref:hypothetical protein n=1 Tax=uncultured Limosilactobacillus sp. TaxID=2837629 RepID=UPI0025F28FD3|nr:hypothetical protein [uncultured Limosilactobacillus sp.]
MPLFYRLKNPISNKYYICNGCLVDEVDKEIAPVYSEKVAKGLLHDANTIQGIISDHFKKNETFPGYDLEEVKISEVPLDHKQMAQVRAFARDKHISVMESATKYRLHLVNIWDSNTKSVFDEMFHHEEA